PSAMRRMMPGRCQLVEYCALPDKLLIWVLKSDGLHTAEVPCNYVVLKDSVSRFLNRILNESNWDEDAFRADAEELYSLLIEPIRLNLDDDKQLCIVPDKCLNYLPFCALISPATKRYLVEHYAILYSPSVSMFALCTKQAEMRRADEETFLGVGDPTFDR